MFSMFTGFLRVSQNRTERTDSIRGSGESGIRSLHTAFFLRCFKDVQVTNKPYEKNHQKNFPF